MRLSELVRACFTGLWIESHEHDDAITAIAKLCHEEDWRLATWDIDSGLKLCGTEQAVNTGTNDLLAAVKAMAAFPVSDQSILAQDETRRYVWMPPTVALLQPQMRCELSPPGRLDLSRPLHVLPKPT